MNRKEYEAYESVVAEHFNGRTCVESHFAASFCSAPCCICKRPEGGGRHQLKLIAEDDERGYLAKIYVYDLVCPDCIHYAVTGRVPDSEMPPEQELQA